MQKLMDKSIMELAPPIQAKQLSPLYLVKECLRRIEDTEPLINSYITVLREVALVSAAPDWAPWQEASCGIGGAIRKVCG